MRTCITLLGLALLLGGCASSDQKADATAAAAPKATAQDAAAQKAAEQQAAMEARATAAREIAKAQQAQRELEAQQMALRAQAEADAKVNEQAAAEAAKAAQEAEQAAADKAAAEKAAADAAKAAADKAAADKAAATAAAAGTAAAAASKDAPVNPYDLNVVAEVQTTAGTMVLGFYPDVAPGHVKNFVDLARKGFYDGTLFHRVIKGFMIQGGDPNTKDPTKAAMWGQGGPGYKVKAEFSPTKHVRGTLSMARQGTPNVAGPQDPLKDTAGSQFFICHAAAPSLDGNYTAFGELLTGYDVLDKIATAPARGDKPQDPVKILKVTVRPRTPDDKKQGG